MAYSIYDHMFSNLEQGLLEQKFRINFAYDGGSGPSKLLIDKRFGLEKGYIEFTPSVPGQLHSAIAGMLTYLTALPDAYASVKIVGSSKVFFWADFFSILSLEYIQDHNLGSARVRSTSMWDGSFEGLTPYKFNQYQSDISGIFTHNDLHHFLAFDSPFEDMLETLELFFQTIDNDITIDNLKDPNKNIKNLYPL